MKYFQSFYKSLITILSIGILTKFIGLLKEILIARKFGTGFETDAYFVAIVACTITFVIISVTLSTALIPILAKIRENYNKINFINFILLIFTIASLVVAIFSFFITDFLVEIFAAGFQNEKKVLTSKLIRIGLPLIVLNTIFRILSSFLNSNRKFNGPALEGISISIPIIIYLIFFNRPTIIGLMTAFSLSGITKILMLVPSLNGTYFNLNIKPKNDFANLRRLLIVMFPITLGSIATYINTIFDQLIASNLVEGSISYLTYALRVKQLVTGILVTSFISVYFPISANSSPKQRIQILNKSIKIGVLLMIPLTGWVLGIAEGIIAIIYERGEFNSEDTKMVSSAFRYYSFGFLSLMLNAVISKTFYAKGKTIIPVIINSSSIAVNILLSFLLSKYMNHNGIAFATSISSSISVIALIIAYIKKYPGEVKVRSTIHLIAKCTLVTTIAFYMLDYCFLIMPNLNYYFKTIISFIIGLFIYYFGLKLIKVKEINFVNDFLKKIT